MVGIYGMVHWEGLQGKQQQQQDAPVFLSSNFPVQGRKSNIF